MEEHQTPIALQQSFWNKWNAEHREKEIQDISMDQAKVVHHWLADFCRTDLDIIEVGCGAGWFCPQLTRYGNVTGTDLSNELLERARDRAPEVTFIAGDFMELNLGAHSFDVVVTLEVLSHVADQEAFMRKIVSLLRPGGHLMMATQNRFVLQRFNRILPPAPGQLRKWFDRAELCEMLHPYFDILELFSITPRANRGIMRIVNSYKLNRLIRMLVGDRVDRIKEGLGLGWTLMVLGKKR